METIKKKLIFGIFISFLTIFAMSHNAGAINLQYDLNNYDIAYSVQRPRIVFNFQNSSITGNPVNMSNATGPLISGNFETLSWDLKAGDLITFDLIAYNSSILTTGETASGSLSNNLIFSRFVGSGFSIISVEPVNISSNFDIINYYLDITCRTAGTGQNCTGYPEISLDYHYYSVYKIILRADRNISGFNFSFTGSTTQPVLYLLNAYNQYNISLYFERFVVYRITETQENKEVEEKTQGAVDDSQAAGGSSSQDAQTGTTGLLNAITGAVSVISSASPTNCKINGNMGNLDIGQIDLCANPVPTFIQTIGSLLLILMCVPLAISLFNRFIALFRSFQD